MISVPLTAETDEDAVSQGVEYAHSLRHPGGGDAVAGHLEFVGEVREGLMEMIRVVDEDPLFLKQLPPDWQP